MERDEDPGTLGMEGDSLCSRRLGFEFGEHRGARVGSHWEVVQREPQLQTCAVKPESLRGMRRCRRGEGGGGGGGGGGSSWSGGGGGGGGNGGANNLQLSSLPSHQAQARSSNRWDAKNVKVRCRTSEQVGVHLLPARRCRGPENDQGRASPVVSLILLPQFARSCPTVRLPSHCPPPSHCIVVLPLPRSRLHRRPRPVQVETAARDASSAC